MGWMINFDRRSAFLVMVAVMALIVIPPVVVTVSGGGSAACNITGIVSIAAACLLCAYLSSTKRWSH